MTTQSTVTGSSRFEERKNFGARLGCSGYVPVVRVRLFTYFQKGFFSKKLDVFNVRLACSHYSLRNFRLDVGNTFFDTRELTVRIRDCADRA